MVKFYMFWHGISKKSHVFTALPTDQVVRPPFHSSFETA